MAVSEIRVTGEHVARLAADIREQAGALDDEGRALIDLLLVRALGRAPESRKEVLVPAIFWSGAEKKTVRAPLLRIASMGLGIDELAIGPKQDDPHAIGPKQDDPHAIGPKQDDPGTPPKFEWGVIMGERGGAEWGVIMGERGVSQVGVIMGERKRGERAGVREFTVTDAHVASLAQWLGGLARRLGPEARALLDLLLIRGGEAPPEDPRSARVPALLFDAHVDAGRTLAAALGADAAAIGPKQDDPGVPPKLEWGVIMGERGTPEWSKMFTRRAARS